MRLMMFSGLATTKRGIWGDDDVLSWVRMYESGDVGVGVGCDDDGDGDVDGSSDSSTCKTSAVPASSPTSLSAFDREKRFGGRW